MKNNRGYLLLESVVCLSIIITVLSSLYFFIGFCNKYKKSTEDKIELYEQGEEIQHHINSVIESSEEIISIRDINGNTISENVSSYVNVESIKCKCANDYELYGEGNKNKEISHKRNTHKVFINTLYRNNGSETGGNEKGDYVDLMWVKIEGNKVTIKLNLSKNKEKYEKIFSSYMKDF